MPSEGEARFAKLAAYARAMTPVLDEQSYYQLLELAPGADRSAIRSAFYRVAGDLHPDRYHSLGDPATREQLQAIYARISEGYRVLSNPQKRAAYDRGLATGHMRLLTTEREKKGPQNPDEAIKHPEAKKFYRLALQSAARLDWKGAVMNLKFAKTFDSTSALIADKLREAEAALKK